MVHPFDAGATLATMAGSHGSVDVAGGAEFYFLGLLSAHQYKGHNNVAIDVLVFGDSGKLLIDFIAVFLG